jgi:ATP-dependent protease ClpP protease subunit
MNLDKPQMLAAGFMFEYPLDLTVTIDKEDRFVQSSLAAVMLHTLYSMSDGQARSIEQAQDEMVEDALLNQNAIELGMQLGRETKKTNVLPQCFIPEKI